MGITAATLSSYAVHETLPSQSQNTGNNQITVSDDIQNITGNNGQVTGTDYVGRLIVLNLSGEGSSGTEQTRYVITDAAGTGTTRILTVSEDWDTNPNTGTSDTIHVFYNMGDLDGVVSEFNTRTGFYEMTNPIIVGNGTAVAGLFMGNGDLVEIEDSKSASVYSLEIQNNGRLQCGYLLGGVPVAGAYFTGINNSQGEAWTIFESGGEGRIYDTRMIASLNPLQFNCANGSDVQMDNFSIFQGTDEGIYFDASLSNGSITGAGTTTEPIRVDAGSSFDTVVLIETDGLHTAASDTTTETLAIKNCVFIANNDYIVLANNKTWNVDNPTWGATTNSDFEDTAVSGSATVNDRRTVDAVVQEADGTKLQNALVNVYENTQLADLVQELTTDANGVASGAFNYISHVWTTGTGATTTYGGHALQAGKWLYEPFVAAQVSTEKFDGVVILSPDPNIVQTTQATAKSAGSTVTWNEDTNPSALFGFDTGSGTLLVGMILTFSGGATGTITESKDGDSVSGVLHLKDRNATAIGATDTFSRTGGTAGTFSGTCNAAVNPVQEFAIWIDAQTLSYQTIYDYLSAIQTETTLTADGELIWEWCRSAQSQALYATGSSFFTERSNGKGVIIVDGGSGTVDYFTDDAGVTWTAPATVTVEVTVLDNSTGLGINLAHVQLYLDDFSTVVMSTATNASGLASVSYTYTVDEDVNGWARQFDIAATDYIQKDISGTITSSGLSLTVRLDPIT
jgi:hypothetical protein